MQRIKPEMTIISVGPNVHGLPKNEALALYAKHSTGSSNGSKVWRTDEQGNMKLTLKDEGGWTLSPNQ